MNDLFSGDEVIVRKQQKFWPDEGVRGTVCHTLRNGQDVKVSLLPEGSTTWCERSEVELI